MKKYYSTKFNAKRGLARWVKKHHHELQGYYLRFCTHYVCYDWIGRQTGRQHIVYVERDCATGKWYLFTPDIKAN